MNKFLLHKTLILVSFFFITSVYAQTVSLSGRFVDEKNTPLSFIEVIIYENEELVLTESCDENGKFNFFIVPSKYKFVAESFGEILYEEEINIQEDTNLKDIKITNTSILLQDAVIVGTKPIFKQEYDKFIFNVENSPLKQGYDGLEVLKRSPKLQVNSKGSILLRNQSVLVLVNGRKMNMSGEELSNYLSSINSENIKSIEIQDVGSAETDASNSGGVINIVLKKTPTGFQSTIKTFYMHRNEENQLYSGGITNQFGSEKWNIYNKFNYRDDANLSKFNSTTRFYNNNGRNENGGETDYQNKNFNTTTGIVFYPNEKHEIGTEIYYSHGTIDRNGWENLEVYNPDLNAVSENKSIYFNKNIFWDVVANYSYKLDSLGSKIKIIADIGNNTIDNRNEVDTRYTFGNLEDNKNRFLTDAKSNFYNIQLDWNQKLKSNLEFSFGAKLSNVSRENELNTYLYENDWELTADGQENFENTENVLANYLSISTKLKEKHQLKIGLRTEYTDLKGNDFVNNTEVKQNYFDWFPNFFYAYQIKENQNLSFSYSRRIQRPSFRDLNPFIIKQNDFLYQIGNPNLHPQYTNKFDLTYQRKKQSFSLYADFTNDMIMGVYTTQGNISYYKPQNFGKMRNLGFDYSFYGDITKWLYSNISLGGWHYDFETQNLQNDRFSFYISTYSQVKFSKTFFLDVNNSFYSKNQFGVTQGAEQYQLDLALQKNILDGAGLIRIACEDVFNTSRDKNTSYYENFDFRFYQKRVTRSFVLMLIYTFKNKGKFNERNVQQGNDNKGRL